MFARTRYIEWAIRFYGQVPFDLATSGIPNAPALATLPIDDLSGYKAFRESIAEYNQVDPAEVAPALGTSGALFLAYASTLGAGDEVLIETPGYEPLTRAAAGTGAIVRTFERRAEEGFRVVPERVAGSMTPRTRAIVVTNLHNPTGVRIDDSTLRELAAIAEARSAYLVVDEVYAPFDALPEDGLFRGSARTIAPNVITVGSLTKCYGLGPHRIGWLLAPPEIIAHAEAAAIATYGHLPLSHAHYGVAGFAAIPTLAKRAKALFAGKRAIAERWAKAKPGIRWSAPREGLFGMVTVDGAGDLTTRIEEATKTAGVLVGAGSFFGVPNGFRLSWASLDAARFEEGLSRLDAIVR